MTPYIPWALSVLALLLTTAPSVAVVAPGGREAEREVRPAPVVHDFRVVVPPGGVPAPRDHAVAKPAREAAALSAFQAGAAVPFSAGWDPDQPHVRTLTGGRSRAYTGEPEAAAREFARAASGFLGPDAAAALDGAGTVRETGLGPQVTFRQRLGGVPVIGRELSVSLTPAGEVIHVQNTTAPLPGIDVTPSISALRAVAGARGPLEDAPELLVDASGPEPRLVWRFTVNEAPDRLMRYLVDARTGETRERRNMVQFITGRGSVYRENPTVTSTLQQSDLNNLTGVGRLTGLYTDVFQYGDSGELLVPTQITKADHQFLYAAGTPEQSQVQAYWGIEASHEYFKSRLGFTGRDHVIPAYTRIPGLANAFFSRGTSWGGVPTPNGFMGFGYGRGVSGSPERDFAADQDVLIHEYTHAVVNTQNPAFADGIDEKERGGISEGNADYFAVTNLGNPLLGEYAGEAFGVGAIRDLRVRNHFPDDITMRSIANIGGTPYLYRTYAEEHRTGEIWGPALLDLRGRLGKARTDRLVFAAMGLLNGSSDFSSAHAALITADQQIYGGANASRIREVFHGRGIQETSFGVPYLASDAFRVGASTFRIGTVGTNSSGTFFDENPSYFTDQSFFPVLIKDQYQLLEGYLTDSTILAASVEIRDAANTIVGALVLGTIALPAYDVEWNPKTYRRLAHIIAFGSATFTQDLTNHRLYLKFFTEPANTVAQNYWTTTPKVIAPSPPNGYPVKLLTAATTPAFPATVFGDADGNGKAELADSILVARAALGQGTLTADQNWRCDVAEPFNGTPNAADVAGIGRIAAGLEN